MRQQREPGSVRARVARFPRRHIGFGLAFSATALPGGPELKDTRAEEDARTEGEGVVGEVAGRAEEAAEDHERQDTEKNCGPGHESTFAVADAVVAQCERGDGGQVADAGAGQGRSLCVLR